MAIVEARGLTKRFEDLTAVDHVSFSIEEGEIFGLVGPNGAGKTTTINMFTTLLTPTEGTAIVAGFDVTKKPNEVRRRIGLVPQDLTVDEDLTGRENMWLQSRLYGLRGSEVDEKISRLLDLVNLTDAADKRVEHYSGGMRKRLELVEGLINDPQVLLLDEPTLGLDVQTRSAIWSYIGDLRREKGITILLTTHYMEEADRLCDRVAIIDHGKIVALDTPSNLKASLGGDVIELEFTNGDGVSAKLESDPAILAVQREGLKFRVKAKNGDELLPRLMETLIGEGMRPSRVELVKPSLDQVYLEYTGKSLREEQGSSEEAWRFRRNVRSARA